MARKTVDLKDLTKDQLIKKLQSKINTINTKQRQFKQAGYGSQYSKYLSDNIRPYEARYGSLFTSKGALSRSKKELSKYNERMLIRYYNELDEISRNNRVGTVKKYEKYREQWAKEKTIKNQKLTNTLKKRLGKKYDWLLEVYKDDETIRYHFQQLLDENSNTYMESTQLVRQLYEESADITQREQFEKSIGDLLQKRRTARREHKPHLKRGVNIR